MTNADTTITCTKSEFAAKLHDEYQRGIVIDRRQADELDEVIDGLVRQADQHRGTFTGYNAYLDLDFTVTPDEDPRNPATVHFQGVDGESLCGMPARDLDGTHHRAVDYYNGDATCERCNTIAEQTAEPIAIPAVTTDQRIASATAALDTIMQVRMELAGRTYIGEDAAAQLDALAAKLTAAAGHVRIASGEVRLDAPKADLAVEHMATGGQLNSAPTIR